MFAQHFAVGIHFDANLLSRSCRSRLQSWRPLFPSGQLFRLLLAACAACCTAAGTSELLIVCSSCAFSFAWATTPSARLALTAPAVNRFFIFIAFYLLTINFQDRSKLIAHWLEKKAVKKIKVSADKHRMSGRTRQASALFFVSSDQLQDLGLKCVLRGENGADPLSERLLLKFLLNRQAEFSQFFDIRS